MCVALHLVCVCVCVCVCVLMIIEELKCTFISFAVTCCVIAMQV